MDMQKLLSIKRIILGLLLIGLLVLGGSCRSHANGEHEQVRILILHSYHIEYEWTQTIDDGISSVLDGKGYIIKKIFMDTKRHSCEAFKTMAGQNALAVIQEFKPQILLAVDDNAQEYCARFLVNRPDIAIVFCGVNADITTYNYPGTNATGVIERPYVRESIEILKKLTPNIRSISVLTDKGNTSDGFVRYLKDQNIPIQIDKIQIVATFAEWKSAITHLQSDAIMIYTYHTLMEQDVNVPPQTVMQWTNQHLNKPSIGFFNFAVQDGILLGNAESGFEHGQLAAQKVIEIIQGKKTTEITVTKAEKRLILVNGKTAARLGIDITPLRTIADKIFE